MNRKGYVGDVLTWGLIIVFLVIIVFFSYNFLDSAGDNAGSDTPIIQSSLQSSTVGWAKGWDIAIVAGFGLMLIVTIVSAWMIGTNPYFFWISLIVLIFFMLMLTVLHNLAGSFVGEVEFMNVMAAMPGTSFIINNLFILCVGGAGLLIITLFAKNRSEG